LPTALFSGENAVLLLSLHQPWPKDWPNPPLVSPRTASTSAVDAAAQLGEDALHPYNIPMIRTLGKLMQVTGMVILPVAMVMQLTDGIRAPVGGFTVSTMLLLMISGVAMFMLGRIVEGYGGS
jgi:hypothetical protein